MYIILVVSLFAWLVSDCFKLSVVHVISLRYDITITQVHKVIFLSLTDRQSLCMPALLPFSMHQKIFDAQTHKPWLSWSCHQSRIRKEWHLVDLLWILAFWFSTNWLAHQKHLFYVVEEHFRKMMEINKILSGQLDYLVWIFPSCHSKNGSPVVRVVNRNMFLCMLYGGMHGVHLHLRVTRLQKFLVDEVDVRDCSDSIV